MPPAHILETVPYIYRAPISRDNTVTTPTAQVKQVVMSRTSQAPHTRDA